MVFLTFQDVLENHERNTENAIKNIDQIMSVLYLLHVKLQDYVNTGELDTSVISKEKWVDIIYSLYRYNIYQILTTPTTDILLYSSTIPEDEQSDEGLAEAIMNGLASVELPKCNITNENLIKKVYANKLTLVTVAQYLLMKVMKTYIEDEQLLMSHNKFHAMITFKFSTYGFTVTDQQIISDIIQDIIQKIIDGELVEMDDVVNAITSQATTTIDRITMFFINTSMVPDIREKLVTAIKEGDTNGTEPQN